MWDNQRKRDRKNLKPSYLNSNGENGKTIQNGKENGRKDYVKTKKEVMTDDVLNKGHAHKEKEHTPRVCPACRGWGRTITSHTTSGGSVQLTCNACGGEGVIY